MVYYAHIHSHISYGLVLWGTMIDNTTKQKIDRMITKCIKLISGKVPSPQSHSKLGIPTIHEMVKLSKLEVRTKTILLQTITFIITYLINHKPPSPSFILLISAKITKYLYHFMWKHPYCIVLHVETNIGGK